MQRLTIYTDGASKGNPGDAAIGVVIKDEDNNILIKIGEYIGKQTNNNAEYTALIRGLEESIKLKSTHVNIISDSELMVKQLKGEYRVKSESIIPLYNNVIELIRIIGSFNIKHVKREENRDTDKLANDAIKSYRKLNDKNSNNINNKNEPNNSLF